MKRLLQSALLLLAFALCAAAQTTTPSSVNVFRLGDREVSIPSPEGFVEAAAGAASAQEARTPAPGSAERKAVADALRAPVEKELKQKVVFKIDHLKVSGDWAFLRGVPQRPGGGRVDYSTTAYQQRIEDGVFDDWICALLRKREGKWQVVKYVIGATDVVYEGWDAEYKAPSSIFN